MPSLLQSLREHALSWKLLVYMLLLTGLLLGGHDLTMLRAQPLIQPDHSKTLPGFSADQVVEFAEQLMREGEYYRAITEYRRFLFSYPDDPRQAMIHFRIGIALYRGQRYEDALLTFREVAARYPDTPYARQAWLWQGESLMRQTRYEAAGEVYTGILKHSAVDDLKHHAQYQRAWTLLYQRQWRAAAEDFRRVPPESHLYRAAQHLAEEAPRGEQLLHKSPVLAGILSGILPGSGQLYNGRIGDALLAVFLNGLFVVGTIEAIQSDEFAIAGVLSFFEAAWYTGNIYSAVNGAHKHNRHGAETFIRNLDNQFRTTPPEAHNTIGLRFSLNF